MTIVRSRARAVVLWGGALFAGSQALYLLGFALLSWRGLAMALLLVVVLAGYCGYRAGVGLYPVLRANRAHPALVRTGIFVGIYGLLLVLGVDALSHGALPQHLVWAVFVLPAAIGGAVAERRYAPFPAIASVPTAAR
jgi:hypothetical protein